VTIVTKDTMKVALESTRGTLEGSGHQVQFCPMPARSSLPSFLLDSIDSIPSIR
jgi:hypothetical protein